MDTRRDVAVVLSGGGINGVLHDRELPRITVRATAGPESLEPSFRNQRPWTDEAKRSLIERGYELTDAVLRAEGLSEPLAS